MTTKLCHYYLPHKRQHKQYPHRVLTNYVSIARAQSSSSSSSSAHSSSAQSSYSSFDEEENQKMLIEASKAVERAEIVAKKAEQKLNKLSREQERNHDDDNNSNTDERKEKMSSSSKRVQELAKSLEQMKKANEELRKKKSKTASASTSQSSSSSSSNISTKQNDKVKEEEEENVVELKSDTENNFGGGSQRRLYDQMLTLRTRLNERVASSNAFAKYLEKTLLTRDGDLKRANELLYSAAKESGELLRLIRDAQNDISKSGEDITRRKRGEQKLEKFVVRLQLIESELSKNAKDLDSTVVRTVPIEYHGIASDVIMMGDFDNWTRGVQLYPAFVEGGSSTFTGDARLAPGTYLIKFKVDGEWRLARDWPQIGEGFDANNVLLVA